MPPRIFVAEPENFDPDVHALLSREAEVVLEHATPARLVAAFAEFDAVWIRLGFRVGADALGHAPRCRAIACPATGLDHIDVAACAARGIRVVSLKGEVEFLKDVRATAELTVGLMLALLRRIPWAATSVCEARWNRDLFRGRELHEKTVGLVGLGRLGSLVSKMLRGFDVEVIGYDPRHDFPHELATRTATLHELLERSDIVSLHVSLDASTRHLIGPFELARMRPHAVLVNTSRGEVVDEAALVAALEEGRIGGAALDVLTGEPQPELNARPLVTYARRRDNLLIVPHIGGNTWESTRKTELFIAKRLLDALSGTSHP